MRTEGSVKHKLNQVIYRRMKSYVDSTQKRRPENCKFNVAQEVAAGMIRLCSNKESGVLVCDEQRGGLSIVSSCDKFCPSRSPEDVKREFHDFMDNARLAEIAHRYPEIVALSWVLNKDLNETPRMIEIDPESRSVQLRVDDGLEGAWRYYPIHIFGGLRHETIIRE